MTEHLVDFLYVDHRRIEVFLSQMNGVGAPTGSTSKSSSSSGVKKGWKAGGRIPGVSFDVNAQGDDTEFSETQITANPFWQNAMDFLEGLGNRGALQPPETARVGDLVNLSGSIKMVDYSLINTMLTMKSVQSEMMKDKAAPSGNRAEKRAGKAQGAKSRSNIPSEIQMAIDIMGAIPMPIKIEVKDRNVSAWGSVREDGLIGSSADMLLKHGIMISGVWTVVGILDTSDNSDSMESECTDADNSISEQMDGVIGSLAGVARELVGRSEGKLGITPLVIYRIVDNDRV